MLVLLLGMLGLSVAAVELTKEVKVDGSSLVAADGTHVQVRGATEERGSPPPIVHRLDRQVRLIWSGARGGVR